MRIIGHLDMDAFFAAIEERDNPRFRGKPIVVGADPKDGEGRGVVSTANYKAREYGIHSAMPISRAWRFSEEARKNGKEPAIFLGGSFKKYGEVSRQIMEIVSRYSPLVEAASVDEAYFDLSHLEIWEEAERAARKLKSEIAEKLKLTASVGIGPNKLIAKIASDYKKPDGLTIVREEEAEKFLEPLSIRKVPGIGPKTEEYFIKKNICFVRDLKKYSKEELREMLGKWGGDLYLKIRGVHDSPVGEEGPVKSIGEQETFEKDTKDPSEIFECLKSLSADVYSRFANSEFATFGRVVVTIRFEDFVTKTKSHTLAEKANTQNTLEFEALKLVTPFLDTRENPRQKQIRLVGVRVEKLN